MPSDLRQSIQTITGRTPTRLSPLSGGCVGDVYKVSLSDGEDIVAKVGDDGSGLAREGMMLRYLRDHSSLPVPDVYHADDHLLLMAWIESGGSLGTSEQIHAADLVAALHDVSAETFGFPEDTVIGGLHQPNPETGSWLSFFRDHRLMSMGLNAMQARRLPGSMMKRLEAFSANLSNWLSEPDNPSLIHGDMWGGNVLAANGRITGFIDPAIYFADAEIELAFTTMFSTFGDAFFDRYEEHRPLKPGFFEERRAIYNLYPLLVHVRLFGGSYVSSVDGTLRRFGF